MQQIVVDLNISREEWLKIYRGETNLVYARSRDGRSIQFPANILNPYTSHSGVQGSFIIYFDERGKFHSLVRMN